MHPVGGGMHLNRLPFKLTKKKEEEEKKKGLEK